MARAQAQPPDQTTQAAAPPPAGGSDAAHLATQLNNPISSLISVPFQTNYDCCFGDTTASRWLTNIQPVVPMQLTDDWNLIMRTILPVIHEQWSPVHQTSNWGIGDVLQSFFFSPRTDSTFTWGVGPALHYPTGTDSFGTHQWAGGPTVVALEQEHGWTYGALVYQIWSFGNGGPHVTINQMFLQPFVAYTLPTGFTVSMNTETTHDWTNQTWNVPVNLDFSQVFHVESQAVQFQIGPRYYVSIPNKQLPRWGARFNLTFLFPK
jgi:hypothetical protein